MTGLLNRLIMITSSKYIDEAIEIKNKILDYYEMLEDTIDNQHDAIKSAEKRGIKKATDEFKLMTCENCKHISEEDKDISGRYECNKQVASGAIWTDYASVDLEFGCNKFESNKEKK